MRPHLLELRAERVLFPTTHWSLLAKATSSGDDEARLALEELCRRYWAPIHHFIRFRGYPGVEADDLTQEFLLHLLERSALRKPDPLRGRFRSFLLGALGRFLGHKREERLASKRGGQHVHVSVESIDGGESLGECSLTSDESTAFDRSWALTILRAALRRVEDEYHAAGKAGLFPAVRPFLPYDVATPTYEQAAAQAGLSLAAFNSEIHRLRRALRDAVHEEVTATVSAPHEIDQEIAHLYQVLMNRGTSFQPEGER